MSACVRRRFVDLPDGQIHYAEAGQGDPPILLLHQTPRSWAEYRHVLPLLGKHRRTIAMDTIGFGDSSAQPREDSIEAYAEGAAAMLDALSIERAIVVGHHTGGVIAIQLAATQPDRVERLVLSCTPLADEVGRAHGHEVDNAPPALDGSHITKLWSGRQPFYPAARPDLLQAFVLDALKAGHPRAVDGHRAVRRYIMEDRLPQIEAPVLLLGGTLDVVYDDLSRMSHSLPGSRAIEIDGGMVPLPDQMPREFASAVLEFVLA